MNFCPPKPRIDRHDQDQIDHVDHRLDALDRGPGIHGDAGFLAERADRLQRAMNVRTGLDVDGDEVGAGFGEGFQIRIARRDHQVDVERLFGVPRSDFTTSGPKVMLGTKWPSMTSTWIQSAPAASTARTSSPSLAKSAARIDGAMIRGVAKASSRICR